MDYPLLANIVAHARFVGVGESTHGTHEFFEFKASLFKELVLHHRFNTLLLEDSADVCRDINKYIKYGVGDLPALMSRLYSVWRIEELQELLEWLHKNSSNYLLEFIGFDIKQTSGNLSVRDELMAANILRLAKKNSSMKALVWAHNTHIKYDGVDHNGRHMGKFLKKKLRKDYLAIGQFFGKGSFSATIIDEKQPDWTNRKLSSIDIDQVWDGSLEATLQGIGSSAYYLDASKFTSYPALTQTQWARSFGWGLKLSELDQVAERINIPLDFDMFTYFPIATHGVPLVDA